jgi:murein DD-endopeptidase MepM/ murein hydrolase activator NlpD
LKRVWIFCARPAAASAFQRLKRQVFKAVPLIFCLLATGCSIPRWPVDAPVASPYGLRFLGWRPDFHNGVDLAVPVGSPVTAMKKGDVAFAGEMSGYGRVVILQHGPRLRTVYGHLSEILVRTGDRVANGQVIAKSGRSGNASGAHLHFEIQRWGREEDPVELLGGLPARE